MSNPFAHLCNLSLRQRTAILNPAGPEVEDFGPYSITEPASALGLSGDFLVWSMVVVGYGQIGADRDEAPFYGKAAVADLGYLPFWTAAVALLPVEKPERPHSLLIRPSRPSPQVLYTLHWYALTLLTGVGEGNPVAETLQYTIQAKQFLNERERKAFRQALEQRRSNA
ncbi:MAG TPA: hypothetical protein VI756_00850 [Blastocatellia bacterium]